MPHLSTYEINPAVPLVVEGHDRYIRQGDVWMADARYNLSQLANLNLQPVVFGGSLNLVNLEQAFTRPDKPTAPALPSISQSVPSVPALRDLLMRELGDAPADPALDHLLAFTAPDRPNVSLPARPDVNVPLVEIQIADRGAIQIPALRTLLELGVVDFTPMVMPTFQGVRPSFAIDVPADGQLDFEEIDYTPELFGAIKTALNQMLQGGLGLPLAVEQAMFDRARAREDRLSRKQVQEVSEDLAARGLTEPNGILAARLREVRADNREKAAGLNRDITIETAKIAVENLRAAIPQGIALEQVLLSKYEAQNARALQIATFAREYALKRVDALVAIANLEQQAYATDASVFKTLVEAEVSKLAELEAKIKLEALKGQVNENLIREYEAQWKGVQAMADFYRTDVEAAKAKGEINKQRIEAAELQVRMYGADVDVMGKLFDAHRADVEASMAPLKAAEVVSSVFANRINAYRAKGEAYRDEARLQVDANQQSIELFNAQLRQSEGVRAAEMAQLDAVLRRFAGVTAMYQADGQIAAAESASRDRTTALAIEQNRAVAESHMKAQELQMQQMLKIGEIMLAKFKGIADVYSQLVAASQSAVNLGASVSLSSDAMYQLHIKHS